jgi:cytochrome bd-type quinol oxidase subunit 2
VSLAAAASPFVNLKVMLLGMIILVPIMLIYNAYQFSVFWEKAEGARDEK